MKLNRLETHDRLLHYKKNDFDIGICCQDLINKRPFGDYPFYIFAHVRTDDDGIKKRLIWQPRLTKPKAQTNSMLFKAFPGSDNIRICWMIPAPEMWAQYKKGNITEDEITSWSIEQYKNNRTQLEMKEPDDLEDWQIDDIYTEISKSIKPKPLVES